MLVLVSFVLVLAAAVTLVVGLLQSGLALIYLSIGCSVLAGVVLAVAVLRGRPESVPAAAGGRSFSPPPQPAQVPVAVGAPSAGTETSSSWSPPASPPPPPPASTPPAANQPDDSAKAAGAALLGRLRGKRGEPTPSATQAEPGAASVADGTTEMPVVPTPASAEDADGFPIPDYDRLRATELLSQLPPLDRDQLEAVREREAGGKNRFTIMSRIDALLATAEEPAWEVEDDEWEPDADAEPEPEPMVGARVLAVDGDDEEFEEDELEEEELDEDEFDDEAELDDEDEAAMAGSFPIASYETLTVGQILPRLSELDADELAQVRAREETDRSRGTILDRIDRLASRQAPAAMAMPAAVVRAPARKAPARKAPARKALARKAPVRRAPAVSKTTAPAVKKRATAPARRMASPVPVPARPSVRKAAAGRAPAKAAVARKAPAKAVPAPRKTRAPKAVTPVVPAAPIRPTVKKARAAAKKSRKG